MKNYYEILFGREHKDTLFVSASDMDVVRLWVLRNRPMSDYYGMNIISVDRDTKQRTGHEFYAVAVVEYFRESYSWATDDDIRKMEIEDATRRHTNRR